MNKKNILSIFLPLLLLMGCTHEDYRNCPAGYYISFVTDNPKHNYPELVATVGLYFYDQNGDLQADFHYTRNDLRAHDRAAFVPLMPAGNYRLVAVAKSDVTCYETSGSAKYETLETKLKHEVFDYKKSDLFSAEKNITINPPSHILQTETMTLVKHNSNIRMNLLYDGYVAPNDMTLDAMIEKSSGQFNYSLYSNRVAQDVRFLPWARRNGNNGLPTQFDISCFRLFYDCDATITIYETSDTKSFPGRAYTLDIVKELAKVRNGMGEFLYNTDKKLEYHDEYEITMTLGRDFVVLAIVIDKWSIVGGGVVP